MKYSAIIIIFGILLFCCKESRNLNPSNKNSYVIIKIKIFKNFIENLLKTTSTGSFA